MAYHVGLSDQDATELYQRILKTLRAKRHPKQNVLPSATLINRWRRTSVWQLWRLSRWNPLLDRFREAARAGGAVCTQADHQHAEQHLRDLAGLKWMIRVGELRARRLASARRPDWAMHLLADLLRASVDLRREANWPQMRMAIDSEMHLMREIRAIFSRRKAAQDVARDAVEQAKNSFANPMSRGEFFANEYLRRFLARHPDGNVEPDQQQSENLCRAIYTCLGEYETGPQSSRFFQHTDGETKFRFPAEFSAKYGLPPLEDWQLLLSNEVRAEIHDLFIMCETMDARDTAAAATLSYLCVLAHHRQLGFYPENLASACAEFDITEPIDSFGESGRPLQIRLAGGERLKGMGVENHRQKVRTKVGQPIVYSIGPDKRDDRATIVWDGSYQGRGDWVFPLPPHYRPRHWLQFDLRKAMIVMMIAGLFFARYSSPASRQSRAVRVFELAGGTVQYADEAVVDESWSPTRWLYPAEDSSVTGLSLSGYKTPVGKMLSLAPTSNSITNLSIANTEILVGDLSSLGNFPNLESLTFSGCEIEPAEITQLRHLKKLTHLSFTENSLTDEAFQAIPGIPALISLDLNCNDFGATNFTNLKNRFPKLNTLTLYETQVNDRGLDAIGECKTLTHLDLDRTNVTDSGLAKITGLDRLVSLDLQRTGLTDECLQHVSKLSKLEGLILNETKVNGSGFKHLVPLPKLLNLSLIKTLVDDKSLAVLNQCKQITQLSLEETRVTPNATRILNKLPYASITYPDWSTMIIIKNGQAVPVTTLTNPATGPVTPAQ